MGLCDNNCRASQRIKVFPKGDKSHVIIAPSHSNSSDNVHLFSQEDENFEKHIEICCAIASNLMVLDKVNRQRSIIFYIFNI